MADVFYSFYSLLRATTIPHKYTLDLITKEHLYHNISNNQSDKQKRRDEIIGIIIIICAMMTFIVSCSMTYLAWNKYKKEEMGIRIAWTILAFFGSWVFLFLQFIQFDFIF